MSEELPVSQPPTKKVPPRTFGGSRQAAALPAPPAGDRFIEYAHASESHFFVRVSPPSATNGGNIRRQWVFRMKTRSLDASGQPTVNEVREVLGLVTAYDRGDAVLDYDAALSAMLSRRSTQRAAVPAGTTKLRLTVQQAWELRQLEISARRVATDKKEAGTYARYISQFASHFLDELGLVHWQRFSNQLRHGPFEKGRKALAIETIRGILNLAGSMYTTAHAHRGLDGAERGWNPALEVLKKLPASNKPKGHIPPSKIGAVWRAADLACASWARDQLRLYILTGLRHGLMSELTFDEIDFEKKRLVISPHKAGTKRRAVKLAEDSPPIYLPLCETALAILAARREWAPDKHGPVWFMIRQTGGRTDAEQSRHADPRTNWAYVQGLAFDGVSFTPQDLRRTFATLGAVAAFDVFAVSLLLMHSAKTVAKATGLPEITLEYMQTSAAQNRMRKAATEVETYVLKRVAGSDPDTDADDIDLPPELEGAMHESNMPEH